MNLFVLGILSTIATIMVAVIVVGIVKILKLTKQVTNLETTFFQSRGDLYRNIEERIQPIWRQFEDIGRDISMVEQTLRNQIDETRQQFDRAINENHIEMGKMSESDRRYIDSRIDKLIDGYFEHVGAKTPPKKNKELING
jgi:hypothetical protein